MGKFILFITSIFLLILIDLSCLGQATDISATTVQFYKHSIASFQEKIYAHTDRENYLAGETIWFKLYNVDAIFHHPGQISKVAYIELLDAENKPIVRTKIELKDGTGNGYIQLPESIATGNYMLRTYTNWMKNFDPDFYFRKNIVVLNTLSEEPIRVNNGDSSQFDIGFFPEGGNLVSGLNNKLAFKALNKHGRGVDFSGAIVDQNGDTVTRFASSVKGMGSFAFKPEVNAKYMGVFFLPGRQVISKELPQIHSRGYTLLVSENKDGFLVNVQSNVEENEKLDLFIHTRNQIKETFTGNVHNKSLSFFVHRDILADGISHITLFNSRRQPLCERLIFKRPQKKMIFRATSDKQQYASREKVNMEISISDEVGRSQSADVSVSVFFYDSLNTNSSDNINNYLLLSSDLKGHIESPEYYFSDTTEVINNALNNLMLTHGWRRFKWEEILQDKPFTPAFLPEMEGHIISAGILNAQSGIAQKNISTFLSIPRKHFLFYSATSDSAGKLNYYAKNFYGNVEVVAQAKSKNEDLYRIDIATPFSEEYSTRSNPAFSPSSFVKPQLQRRSLGMQVHRIYAADKINVDRPMPTDTLPFYGRPQTTYSLDDYVRFPTMEEVLREYVREINVFQHNKSFSVALIKRLPNGDVIKKDPLVLIDGVPLLGDQNKIFRYDPLKIKELQVINKDYYLGKATTGGIANFITYDGRPEKIELEQNATVLDYEGLQIQREFYHPKYETPTQVNSRLPDFRTLLFWEPNLKTVNGIARFNFYTSDLPGKYTVVIQGLSKDGRAGSKTFLIDVTNPLFAIK